MIIIVVNLIVVVVMEVDLVFGRVKGGREVIVKKGLLMVVEVLSRFLEMRLKVRVREGVIKKWKIKDGCVLVNVGEELFNRV